MTFQLKSFLALILTFCITMIFAPLVIKLMKKLKAGQVILGYVEQHSKKSGTPTMGGVMFLLPTALVALSIGYSKLSLVCVSLTLGYALIGFLDDFIKIKTHNNLGLKPYQKIIGQFGLALIGAFFCYKNPLIGSQINLPFTKILFDLKGWYIPFIVFVYLAMTNAVNLTDGLDGLATSVSIVYFISFFFIIFMSVMNFDGNGQLLDSLEYQGLGIFTASMIGGLLAFLWHNFNPAKIMMGDTGSLGLGGATTCVAVFSKNPLLILFSGIMMVVSCISVIVQVIYFKLTKKRVFLMAPYHHHLEKKGLPEPKIVCIYTIITLLFSTLSLLSAGVL